MNRDQDPRVRAFWRQAAAVIAASGGVTGECQQKLRALADHLQLSEPEWQLAWQTLQSNDVSAGELSRYEQAFTQFLHKEFSRLPNRLLSLKIENKAARIGIEKYQISEVRTRQIIEWECERLQVKRVSRPDAEQYVEQVIIQQLEGATEVDESTRDRLVAFARQWGLDRELVELFVRDAIQENLMTARRWQRRRQRRRRITQIGISLCLLAPLMWLAIYRFALRPTPIPPPVGEETTTLQTLLPEWWPASAIEKDIASWDVSSTGLQKFHALGQIDHPRRADAYADFWQWLLEQNPESVEIGLILLQHVHAADPKPPRLDDWISRPLKSWLESAVFLPLQTAEFRMSFQAWEQVALLASRPGLAGPSNPPDLTLLVRTWLEQQTQVHIETQDSNAVDRVQTYWANELWNRLLQVARIDPSRGAAAVSPVWTNTQRFLDPPTQGRFLQQVLFQVLSHAPEQLSTVRPLVPTALQSLDPSARRVWIEFSLGQPESESITWLRQQILLARNSEIGLKSAAESNRLLAEEIVEMRRQQWAALATARDEVQVYQQRVEEAWPNVRMDPGPDSLARLAAAANLQLSLAEQMFQRQQTPQLELPIATYEYVEQRFATLQSGRLPAPPPQGSVVLTPADQRLLDQALITLDDQDAAKSADRKLEIDRILRMADRVADLSYASASRLASYYLREGPVDEWLSAERALPSFRRWPKFVLALADQLPESNVPQNQALSMVQILTETQSLSPDVDDWRREFALRLRRDVERRLNAIYLAEVQWSKRNWSELANVLDRIYGQRSQWRSGQRVDERSSSNDWGDGQPSRWLWRMASAEREPANDSNTPALHPVFWDWLVTLEPSELERIVLAMELCRDQELRLWRRRLNHADFNRQAVAWEKEWADLDQQSLTVAQRLASAEWALSQIWRSASEHLWRFEILGISPVVTGDKP